MWNSTLPTSTTFSIGTQWSASSDNIAYCFSEIDGYSKFGSYTGNGSADGPFVYCGFKPRFILIKRIDVSSDWFVWDTERDNTNVMDGYLLTNTTGVETGTVHCDILSNGYKIRSATIANVNTGTYIFAAFAECPMKYSTAK